MGVIYYVVCRECKVKRDLSEFYLMRYESETRAQMIELAKEVGSSPFMSTLLATFMGKHEGHDCFITNDSGEIDDVEFPDEDVDYWDADAGGE